MFETAYFSVAIIGLLHGIEPGHGWPVAVLYALNKKNPIFSAILSSLIIGLAHLVSSITVVIVYVLLQNWLDFEAPWIKYIAGAVLIIIAIKMFFEKTVTIDEETDAISHAQGIEHTHDHNASHSHGHKHRHYSGNPTSLIGIAVFAFILGFAHEEEFALLALVAGGINAWILMITYSFAVIIGLMLLTVLGVKLYELVRHRISRFEKYVPKAGAFFLVLMAIMIMLW